MNAQPKEFRPAGLAGLHMPKDLLVKIPEFGDPQWVQRPGGHWYLPLMFDVAGGVTVNVLHYPTPGKVGRHSHDGPVFCYTIEGSWYYPEHPWVAEAGTFAWEPTGDIHTQMVKEAATALFIWSSLYGAISWELFGQTNNAVEDHAGYFDVVAHRLADTAGVPSAT